MSFLPCFHLFRALSARGARSQIVTDTAASYGITGISRAYGGAHSSLSITYSLTPAASLAVQDALKHKLVSPSDPTPEASLAALQGVWVEKELVEALYTKGRETEVLVETERVIRK